MSCRQISQHTISHVRAFWLTATTSLITLLCAYYFEFAQGLRPCMLCQTQRLFFYLLLITATLCLFKQHTWRPQYGHLALLILAAAGTYFALRQLYIQHLPADQIPVCRASFGPFKTPWTEKLLNYLNGTQDCATVHWQLFGLSMAAYSAMLFAGIALLQLLGLSYQPQTSEESHP